MPRARPIAERLWERIPVAAADACWEWQGYRDPNGYGRVSYKRRPELAHRLVVILRDGPLSPGICVLHRCDNPPCCNPAHLFLGTQADNVADMELKGRSRKPGPPPENAAAAKLTWAIVDEIRIALGGCETQAAIARRFNVSAATISHIHTGRKWRK